jgi:hypothetical protein
MVIDNKNNKKSWKNKLIKGVKEFEESWLDTWVSGDFVDLSYIIQSTD